MFFFALATDYDGTLAARGAVDSSTIAALERLKASGRRLLLVTGRRLDELRQVFPRLDLFDLAVLENGALLYAPSDHAMTALAPPPPKGFVERLRELRVEPLDLGQSIVATREPEDAKVLQAIRELGLELQITFNKGAVMVLPPGVNKASGLTAALERLHLSRHNVVAVGDAENDHAFLRICGCSAAVANALPSLKDECDLVTEAPRSAGVTELIDRLIADDLASCPLPVHQQRVALGRDEQGRMVGLSARGGPVLVAGSSGGGKSSLALGLMERMIEAGYQVCAFDPEGDYESFDAMVPVGSPSHAPDPDRVAAILAEPGRSVSVNLLGVAMADRPPLFAAIMARLDDLRSRCGRPHWIVADEAHHLLPAQWEPAAQALPQRLGAMLMVTLGPQSLAAGALASVDTLVAAGGEPAETFAGFGRAIGRATPPVADDRLPKGQVLWWRPHEAAAPRRLQVLLPSVERRRHRRKYADGDLGEKKSFRFRGRDGHLNLRAQNLHLFAQIAEGVDDETWLHHLRQGDYSRWFRDAIKDDDLAGDAAEAENGSLDAAESRRRILSSIEKRYGG